MSYMTSVTSYFPYTNNNNIDIDIITIPVILSAIPIPIISVSYRIAFFSPAAEYQQMYRTSSSGYFPQTHTLTISQTQFRCNIHNNNNESLREKPYITRKNNEIIN